MQPHFENANIDVRSLRTLSNPLAPLPPPPGAPPGPSALPWLLDTPQVDVFLTRFRKAETSRDDMRMEFILRKLVYPEVNWIYTDGSKLEEKSAFAVLMGNVTTAHRITDSASIYTAEAVAIRRALCDLQQVRDCFAFVICSDALSVFQAIANCRIHDPLVADIIYEYNQLRARDVKFIWVPSHVGIVGNERADTAAKAALNEAVTCDVTLPQ